MIIIKTIILISILASSTILGISLANKYKTRVKDLKEIRSSLNMFKTKISYTYEPLPEIFLEIGEKFEGRNSEKYIK